MRLKVKTDALERFGLPKNTKVEFEIMKISNKNRDILGVSEVNGAYYGEWDYLAFAETFGYNFLWGRNVFTPIDIKETFPKMPDSFFVDDEDPLRLGFKREKTTK